MARWTIDDAEELYGTARWGEGYFRIDDKGRLMVTPQGADGPAAPVEDIVATLKAQGHNAPLTLRFPQVLEDRIRSLHESFLGSMKEYGYGSDLRLVYPMKVNQRKEVILELLRCGAPWHYGLEAGSKPEILSAIACDPDPRSLLIVNGFKDREFVELAADAAELDKTVIVVIDKMDEAALLVDVLGERRRQGRAIPHIGIRLKLHARGGGKWAESGGERAKFGLTIPELLHAVRVLKAAGLDDRVKMVHFHIGSQIVDIKRIQTGVLEAARTYAKLRGMGLPVDTVDVGGGLGVDYDGSGTASSASRNYDLREYTNTIVYTLKTVAEEEGVPHPTIVTESGRAVVAYQALLVVELLKKIPQEMPLEDAAPQDDDHRLLQEMRATLDGATLKNYPEAYHDGVALRDELTQRFNFGLVDLETRGKCEILFRHLAHKVLRFAERDDNLTDEFLELRKALQEKFIGNFSLFQSTPDIWGVKQLFPIMPLGRLDTRPKQFGTIVDITCDSDGEIRKFIDVVDVKDTLELHAIEEGPYHVGVFLTGAYQDTLGDFHNLFGRVHEAYVHVGDDGSHKVEKVVEGDSVDEVLWLVNWERGELAEKMAETLNGRIASGDVDKKTAERILATFREAMDGYTYLEE